MIDYFSSIDINSMDASGKNYKAKVMFGNIPVGKKIVKLFNGSINDSVWVIQSPPKHAMLAYGIVTLESGETHNANLTRIEDIRMDFSYRDFDTNDPDTHKTVFFIADSREIRIMNTDDANKDNNKN